MLGARSPPEVLMIGAQRALQIYKCDFLVHHLLACVPWERVRKRDETFRISLLSTSHGRNQLKSKRPFYNHSNFIFHLSAGHFPLVFPLANC